MDQFRSHPTINSFAIIIKSGIGIYFDISKIFLNDEQVGTTLWWQVGPPI